MRKPLFVEAVLRLGTTQFLSSPRPDNWPVDKHNRPRPLGLYSPEDIVDLEHGMNDDLFYVQYDVVHGANLNNPAPWRARTSSQLGASALCHGHPWSGAFFGRG